VQIHNTSLTTNN